MDALNVQTDFILFFSFVGRNAGTLYRQLLLVYATKAGYNLRQFKMEIVA